MAAEKDEMTREERLAAKLRENLRRRSAGDRHTNEFECAEGLVDGDLAVVVAIKLRVRVGDGGRDAGGARDRVSDGVDASGPRRRRRVWRRRRNHLLLEVVVV